MPFIPKGIITALLTPTDSEGNLKEKEARNLIRYVIKGGVHGLFAVGTSGEFYALDMKTKIRMTEITVEEAAGIIPVYMGAAAPTTRESVELVKAAESIGVDAVTILTPVFVKCCQDELFTYYKTVSEKTNLPVLLYANPGSTGVKLTPELVAKLSEIDNIVGIKDSSGDLGITEQYIRKTPEDFYVLAGRDTLILATLVYGGCGAVAATSNIAPALAVSIYEYFLTGDLENAKNAQMKLAPLRHAFGLGTIPAVMLKQAAKLIGYDAGDPISPVGPLSTENIERLKNILVDMGITLRR